MRADQIFIKFSPIRSRFWAQLRQNCFLLLPRKKAVFGKSNYSLFSFSLGPIYEQNMSEINFSTSASTRSIILESRNLKLHLKKSVSPRLLSQYGGINFHCWLPSEQKHLTQHNFSALSNSMKSTMFRPPSSYFGSKWFFF